MVKTYILDTNILLQTEGKVIFGLADNKVIIPGIVLEELDNFKTAPGEKGYAARECIRKIQGLNKYGKLPDNINLPNGGTFSIITRTSTMNIPAGWDAAKPDNIILGTALLLNNESENKRNKTILITNDISMQIKASIVGIHVQDYKNEQIINEGYSGRQKFYVKESFLTQLYELTTISVSKQDLYIYNEENESIQNIQEIEKEKDVLIPSSFLTLKSLTTASTALVYYEEDKCHLIQKEKLSDISGITPKNAGQTFAMFSLMKSVDELPFCLLKGCAGTGKTILSLAAALKQLESGMYDKIVITRSNTLADEELGFLPGTLEDKMSPLLAPFYDNLRLLFKLIGEQDDQIEYMLEDMIERGSIEIVSLAYIRGRSIPNAIIIIDEAQNLSITQAKTIITRAGIGTKIVFLGDPGQIDNPKLDKKNNGLVYLSEKFKGSKLCAQVEFESSESVRSPLASEAIRLLEVN